MTENTVFLTPKEVAKIIGVHPKTVHLWLRTGKLEGTKISYRAWRIPKSSIDAFISQNSNNSQKRGNTTIREGQKKTGTTTVNEDLSATPGSIINQSNKMKYYIRDIMGEDKSTHNDQPPGDIQ
jgi:excisionase family DNA binding protein